MAIYNNILNCYSLTFCFNFFFLQLQLCNWFYVRLLLSGANLLKFFPGHRPPSVCLAVSKFQMQMEQGKRKICLANNKYFLNQFSTCSAIQFCLVNSSFFSFFLLLNKYWFWSAESFLSLFYTLVFCFAFFTRSLLPFKIKYAFLICGKHKVSRVLLVSLKLPSNANTSTGTELDKCRGKVIAYRQLRLCGPRMSLIRVPTFNASVLSCHVAYY